MRTDGTFIENIRHAVNGLEKLAGDTPDHIVAELLLDITRAVGKAIHQRDEWYGVKLAPAQPPLVALDEEFAKKLAAALIGGEWRDTPTTDDLMRAFDKLLGHT